MPKEKNHLLTVMVEDYFHVGAFENLIKQGNWSNFEPRYERNTLKTLDLLDRFETKGTFFILGWVAEQNPALVREIVSRGHEVASRGFYHRSLRNLSPEEFRDDLKRTNGALEDAGGQKVIGYRSAEKLRFGSDEWIFEILAREGLEYDASFMPTKASPPNTRFARQFDVDNKKLWEFPYSTLDLKVGLLPISGGNYFRQLPHSLIRHAVEKWHQNVVEPFVLYFHVWEMDPRQPRISAASRYNHIRHYRKLDKMEWVVEDYLRKYRFTGIADYLGLTASIELEKSGRVDLETMVDVNPVNAASNWPSTPVSIVIPCYNEQEALPYLANTLRAVEKKLKEIGYVTDFIFVDDGSKDATFTTLNELFGDWKNVQIIRHAVNKGVAGGIMTGLRAAPSEIVCSIDCDCTFDPMELPMMLPMLKDNVDMVTASPYHPDGGIRNVPGWRLILSKGASFIYRRILRSKMHTYTSCFRVYRKESMAKIELDETGFHGVTEMLGRLDMNGGRIVEYPTVLDTRLFGASKMKTVRTIVGHVNLMFKLGKMRILGRSNSFESNPGVKSVEATADTFKGS